VVLGLAAFLEDANDTAGVAGSVAQHVDEVGLADVVRTTAGDEDAAGTQHLQGAQIDFFVATQSGANILLRFGKGRRVEDDGVVLATEGGVVLEQVEGVGFEPLNFVAVLTAVERFVLFGGLECGAGSVDAGDAVAVTSEMEGESALVAKGVDALSVGILGGSGVVLALVEEGPRLLAFKGVEVELDTVEVEHRRGGGSREQGGFACGKLLEFADTRLDTLDDRCWIHLLLHGSQKGAAEPVLIGGL